MKHLLFVFFLGGAALPLAAAISQSRSCTYINGVKRCEESSSADGNIAAGSASAVIGPQGSSTYQGAGTGNTYSGNYDVQESSSGGNVGSPGDDSDASPSGSSFDGGYAFPPVWQGSSSYSSSFGSGSGVAVGYSSGGGSSSSSSSSSGDLPPNFPGVFLGGFPNFGGFVGAGAGYARGFAGGSPGVGAFSFVGKRK